MSCRLPGCQRTTAVAFLPLLFVTGAFGQMFQVVPLVVVPACSSRWSNRSASCPPTWRTSHGGTGPVCGAGSSGASPMDSWWFVRHGYEPALDAALRWRYLAGSGWPP